MYIKASIFFEDFPLLNMHTLRYYKNDLPTSKLMGMLEDTVIYFGGKTLEPATILHFSDCLVIHSCTQQAHRIVIPIKRSSSELIMMQDFGLIHYAKDSKDIKVITSPIPLKYQQAEFVLYSSNNYLKKVILKKDENYYYYGREFYIADESKFVKLASIKTEEDGSKFISIDKEWYVNQEFTGVNDFDVIDDMLISCNQFVYLQERGKENPALNTTVDFEGDMMGKMPISSSGSLLFQHQQMDTNSQDERLHRMNSFLSMMPHAKKTSFPIVQKSQLSRNHEYFYYSKEFDEEFIVYLSKEYYYQVLTIEFYRINGSLLCRDTFKMADNINDMYNYGANYDPSTIPTNCDFILSKNGKYLMIYKAFKKEGYFPYSAYYYQDENAEPPKKREDMNEEEKKAYDEKYMFDSIEATVYEIVLVRAKSKQLSLEELAKKAIQNIKDSKKREELIRKHIFSDVK